METTLTYSESTQEFLDFLKLEKDYTTDTLDLLEGAKSRYLADLKINFKNSFESEYLSKKEVALLGVALAVNANNAVLRTFFDGNARQEGAKPEEVAEAVACASLLSANNVFYRFRHFMNKEKYNEIPARIKMNIMARPVVGKEFFELISLAVSAVNGCEMCVTSHEASLIELGSKEERIFESVRLAAVITSLSKVVY
ncbi:carboxymuconolactone decarboxylase family protein [Parachryseolinea silvisoli]|jgi:alkyl hydroperoxide reductase subunit D|uniref:carboxymuconolactone decarboxylase family protein n=1 Tax=Parachryseolinea silvisoli TaxID=2873601 RepID=UPI002265ADB5|nr:carboxymuconolactone decarboxylase family protein [Parachryseolinea silvisoli]MCD9015255.1 carboxymuconolactone decarboxylase family protein [Parachryseolinea silvisoli]